MEWYVYWHDSNTRKIIKWNIFEHSTFRKELNEVYKRCNTKEEFVKRLDDTARCCFWSKCEYEIVLAPWIGDAKEVKIDVYDQLRMNWSKFIDYVWNNRRKTNE